MKRLFLVWMAFVCVDIVCAQNINMGKDYFDSFLQNAQAEYNAFVQQTQKEYDDYVAKANKEYADFMRQAWESYNAMLAIPILEEKQVPPVVIKDEEKEQPVEDKPIVIEEIIDIPAPAPQPEPIAPIKEQPTILEEKCKFVLYGTELQVSLGDAQRFKITKLDEEHIAQTWEQLATPQYNNVILECLAIREAKQLCDWSYLRMLDALANTFLGKETNEAELLKAYIYCQSGYQMRLALLDRHLVMLYGSEHVIYGKQYWTIDGQRFYTDRIGADHAYICNIQFPKEKALSLYVNKEQDFKNQPTEPRVLQSSTADGVKVTVSSDKNLLAFCANYPSSYVNNNTLTRWAMYANMPLNPAVKDMLYPTLLQYIANHTPAEAVDILCRWVQTAFEYEYDDKVWGGDRAFFAEETLYYPYADCEDRSILLTRLVRDLLGLECALVYYPGHLATAVALGNEVKGDYLVIANKRFLVCDPTYIGAPIGMTMPNMDSSKARVIVLK